MVINFQDFLLKLATGQLKNTAVVDKSNAGVIKPEYEDDILRLVNQGLVDITSKKKLFEGSAVLTFVDGQNIYPLDTGAGADFENMHQVYEIVTSDERKHTLKTSAHIQQPNQETLRFSDAFMEAYGPDVEVRFQVLHPTISTSDDINLPTHLHEVLALYVAGLYLAHMGGEEHKARGDSYYGLYLKKLDEDTLQNSSATSEVVDEDTRFYDRGFI